MARTTKIVGAVLLLLVTGGLVVFQINLKNELSDSHEKLSAVRAKLRTLEGKNEGLQRDLRDASNAKGASEIQKLALQRQLSELQEDHTAAKTSADRALASTKAKLNSQLQGAAGETKKLKDQLSTCQKRNTDLLSDNDQQLQAINKELKDTEEQAKACASSKADLQTQLSALKIEASNGASKSDELSGQLTHYRQQLDELTVKEKDCNAMLSTLKTQCEKSSASVAKTTAATADGNEPVTTRTGPVDKAASKDEDNQHTQKSPIPYRGNPGIDSDLETEEGGEDVDPNQADKEEEEGEDGDTYQARYTDGNGKMQDEEGDDYLSKKEEQDAVLEKVFQDEQQKRLDLLGDQGQDSKDTQKQGADLR